MTEYIQQLRNKLLYKLHNIVYDPAAEEYVAAAQKQRNTVPEEKIQNPTGWMTKVEGLTLKGAFSGLRRSTDASGDAVVSDASADITDASGTTVQPPISAQSVGSQVLYYLKQSIYFVFCLIFCMLVANQLITTPWPVRLFGFIITGILLLLNPLLIIGFFAYYIGRIIYAVYENTKVRDTPQIKKRTLLPTIFALLPLTTRQAESTLGSLFLYPFTYPKSARNAQKLPTITDEYIQSLNSSIVNLEGLKKQFSELQGLFTEFVRHLLKMHERKVAPAPAEASINTAQAIE